MAVDALTAEDSAILAPALGDDAEEVAADVAAGAARVVRYRDGSRAVLRLEVTPTGRRELVLVAGAGQGYRDKVAALVAEADRQGWSLRAHTSRPGIGRLLAGLGFTETERIYSYGRQQ